MNEEFKDVNITQEQVKTIKLLFTTPFPTKYKEQLNKELGEKTVEKFLSAPDCVMLKNVVKEKLAGAGVFGVAIKFCLNINCNPRLIMKLIPYDFLMKRLTIDDPRRAENTECKILKQLNDLFFELQDDKKITDIQVPVLFTSFKCSSDIKKNPEFTTFLKKIRSNIRQKNIREMLERPGYFRVMIIENATLGSIDDIMISKWYNRLDPIDALRVWKSIIFQAIMILALLREKWPSFRHNDYHTGNLLISKQKTPLKYNYKGNVYQIIRPFVRVLINDFDYATAEGITNEKYMSVHPFNPQGKYGHYHDVHKLFSVFFEQKLPEKIRKICEIVVPKFIRPPIPSIANNYKPANLTWNQTNTERVKNYVKPRLHGFTENDFVVNTYTIEIPDSELERIFEAHGKKFSNFSLAKIMESVMPEAKQGPIETALL